MKLSFIGMSGIGKSHWSSLLEAHGFRRYCCDDLIATRLSSLMAYSDDTKAEMGRWMGFPYESHYAASEAQYLAYEVEIMAEILDEIEHMSNDQPVVIDTTGSVIYTGKLILDHLTRLTQVVYFEAPMDVQEKMCHAYMTEPAPVLWRDNFTQLPNESHTQALARCYPELLASRSALYNEFADIRLDYYMLRQEDFTVADFSTLLHSRTIPTLGHIP